MKNWSKVSAPVCATISLLASFTAFAQTDLPVGPALTPGKSPAITVLDPAEAPQWQAWATEFGFQVIAPAALAPKIAIDPRVEAVRQAVQQAIATGKVDPARIYVGGRGEAAAAVFYAISRLPDVWAAGIALGGTPAAAVNSDRIFAVNFQQTPVLWLGGAGGDQGLAETLKALGLNLEWRAPTSVTNRAAFDWLLLHRRAAYPSSVDCETNSPSFGRCFWVEMTKFDPAERNDVLPSTHLSAANGAALDLGAFSAKADDPGPGLLIAKLPEKYSGPLKLGDRMVELDGKPIANAHAYQEMLSTFTQEKRVVVMLQRGKEHLRVETRIVVPVRDALVTARVQAKYDPETKGIDIVSRTVIEMKVTIPDFWVPALISWNGLTLENITKPGCLLLTMNKELLHAAVCQ